MSALMLLLALIVPLFSGPPVRQQACPLAPDPRLHAGMQAVVAPGVWGLNLRALPAVATGVRAQVSAGQRMTILDGPSCNGHFHWFRVELPNGLSGWLAEGGWDRVYLLPANADGTPRPLISPGDWSCTGQRPSRRCVEP